MGIGTGAAGLTTSLNYYHSLSKNLTESLEVATGLITLQGHLDSLTAVVLQTRRGLDLLTAEKGGLCLFIDKACCFYANKSVQLRSVTQSCLTLCNPINRSMPGFLVHHQLPEFTQTHVHRVGDAIQPSHALLSSSPPAPNPSQHQGLFQ